MASASVAEVYDQITADLDEAENDLKDVTAPQTVYHVGIEAVYVLYARHELILMGASP